MSSPSLASDPFLRPFTASTFSPISYLNSTLPSTSDLPSLTSQTQSQISALSAQTARLSTTLTALTDDILRCSSRLAYEVELLRGEALGLVESLDVNEEREDGLGAAIRKFLPPSPSPSPADTPQAPSKSNPPAPVQPNRDAEISTNEALDHLRTLLHVRSLLTTTTQTFNAALSFPLPPSLVASTASSLISIAPPAADTNDKDEECGQAALRNLRREISELLATGNEEMARQRIAELRETVTVWKGTSEEKARHKVVDGLEGMVDEAVRKRETTPNNAQRRAASAAMETRSTDSAGSGRGFLGLGGLRGLGGMD